MGSSCLDDMRARGGAGKFPANEPDGRKTILIRQWLLTDSLVDIRRGRRKDPVGGFPLELPLLARHISWL